MNKEQLKVIAANNYALPERENHYDSVKKIVELLGSADPELRDELAMTILSKWLLEVNILTPEQLTELLNRAISDEMLFNKIGEKETDSVFLRSFSSLLIALILYRDNNDEFLSQTTYQSVLERLVTYCEQENDFRGIVEEKGWAHSAAHISDAIDECARSRYAEFAECRKIWTGLFSLLDRSPHVFNSEEDERIATAVTAIIELEKVPFGIILDWLSEIDTTPSSLSYTQQLYRRINIKHFLRSVYFRLEQKELLDEEEKQLFLAIEHTFNPHFHNQ